MKLLDYIRGLRKGKEAHRLEKESMQDPFLADAMDGYSQVDGNHEQQIEKLRMRVATHASKRRNSYAIGWSIAACLIMGIGISTYFLCLKNGVGEDVFIAKKDMAAKPQTESVPKPKAAPVAAPLIEETVEPIAMEEEKVAMDTVYPKSDSTKVTIAEVPAPIGDMIRGIVTDDKGEPIIGAAVYYKGSNIGTSTDLNGEFFIKRMDNKTLTASSVGYNSVDTPVDSSQAMLIAMNEDERKLDEVVVVGLEKQKKVSVVGATVISDKQTDSLTPEPVIGMRQYRKYLKEKMIRPTDTVCVEVKGKVILSFLVNKEGRPYQIEVKQGLCESADKEAIRLIQEGPDWTYANKLVEIEVKF